MCAIFKIDMVKLNVPFDDLIVIVN